MMFCRKLCRNFAKGLAVWQGADVTSPARLALGELPSCLKGSRAIIIECVFAHFAFYLHDGLRISLISLVCPFLRETARVLFPFPQHRRRLLEHPDILQYAMGLSP